jgi:hypothetical protein
MKIQVLDKQNREDFKFGDIIYISKLDNIGRRNLMFVETNMSSLKNQALFQTPAESQYAHLPSYEHFF